MENNGAEAVACSYTVLRDLLKTGSNSQFFADVSAAAADEKGDRPKRLLLSSVQLLQNGDIAEKSNLNSLLERCQLAAERLKHRSAPSIVEALVAPLAVPFAGLSIEGFAKSLDLLPKLLSLSRALKCVDEDVTPDHDGCTGDEFCDDIINLLCSSEWPAGTPAPLTNLLRELLLTDKQKRLAASRALHYYRSATELTTQLPGLATALLLLARAPACRDQVIVGIIQAMDAFAERTAAADAQEQTGCGIGIRLSAANTKDLRTAEDRVLLQASCAMRQDHDLAAAVLKCFKREACPPSAAVLFTPFRISLLLTLARVQRFAAPALDACKDFVLECAVYQQRRASRKWFNLAESATHRQRSLDATAAAAGDGAVQTQTEEVLPLDSVQRALLCTVQYCKAYDHLLPSLQDLAVRLMDLAKPVGKAGAGIHCHLKASTPLAAGHAAAALGCAVLEEAFEVHPLMRRSVLQQVLSRLKGGVGPSAAAATGSSSSSSSSGSLAVHVQLLAALAERSPHLLLEHSQALRDALGYLGTLSPPAARQVLRAVGPLLRLRPQLQDAVVLPLRKALFSSQEETRLVAVEGLILLLRLPQTAHNSSSGGAPPAGMLAGGFASFSQREDAAAGLSQQQHLYSSSSSSGGVAAFASEGFSLLRRCLTQQSSVRSRLYAGLLAAFRDPGGAQALGGHIVSMLFRHFRRYVSMSEAHRANGVAPLQLRLAVDDAQGVLEPLPQLIGVLFCLVCSPALAAASSSEGTQQQQEDEESSTAELDPIRTALREVDSELAALTGAMISADAGVFDLDSTCSFDPGTKNGRANLALASLLLACYEALMAGAILRYNSSAAAAAAGQSEDARSTAASKALHAVLKLGQKRQAIADMVKAKLGSSSSSSSTTRGKPKAAAAKGKGKGKQQRSAHSGDEGESSSAPVKKPAAAAAHPPVSGAHVSAVTSFVLTLEPGGQPCLGLPFVQGVLELLNSRTAGSSSSDALGRVQADLPLQRLVLETARCGLRAMKAGLAPPGGLAADVGGGTHSSPADTPQTAREASADCAAAAAACAQLAPLLLREVRRQLAAGQNSSVVQDAVATAAGDEDQAAEAGSKSGKKGSSSKGKGSKTAAVRRAAAEESLCELALAALEECVLVAAASGPASAETAKRVCAVLAAAHTVAAARSSSFAVSATSSSSEDTAPHVLLQERALQLVTLLRQLLESGDVKEAEVLVRTLAAVTPLLRHSGQPLAEGQTAASAYLDALVAVCSEIKLANPSIVRSLIALLIAAKVELNNAELSDLVMVADVAAQVATTAAAIPDENGEAVPQEEPAPRRPSQITELAVIGPRTGAAAAEAVISAVEGCTEEAEFALALLLKETSAHTAAATVASRSSSSAKAVAAHDSDDESSSSSGSSSSNSEQRAAAAAASDEDYIDQREALLARRLRLLLKVVGELTRVQLTGRSVDRALSITARAFKVLQRALKARITAKRLRFLRSTAQLLDAKKSFCESLQLFFVYVHSSAGEGGAGGSAARTARRSKLMPDVIFEIEQCDAQLLKLARSAAAASGRAVSAEQWVTRSCARDFTLKGKDIKKAMQQADAKAAQKQRAAASKGKKRSSSSSSSTAAKKSKSSSKHGGSSDEEADEEVDAPRSKKAKLGVPKKAAAAGAGGAAKTSRKKQQQQQAVVEVDEADDSDAAAECESELDVQVDVTDDEESENEQNENIEHAGRRSSSRGDAYAADEGTETEEMEVDHDSTEDEDDAAIEPRLQYDDYDDDDNETMDE